MAARAGSNVTATETVANTSNIFKYTYVTPLAAGTYATTVMLHGAQNPNFTGNGTMPGIVVLTSTNTDFTFEFIDYAGGGVLNPAPTTFTVDFVTAQSNP
jgi:hypothetical protein